LGRTCLHRGSRVQIFVVYLNEVDKDGFLVKRQYADLMAIRDPQNLAGMGPIFTFPFTTIESVIPVGPQTIGVLNDNNYPFSSGRTPGEPDKNEFIILNLERQLPGFVAPRAVTERR
jgi:hypothetical protein